MSSVTYATGSFVGEVISSTQDDVKYNAFSVFAGCCMQNQNWSKGIKQNGLLDVDRAQRMILYRVDYLIRLSNFMIRLKG